MIPTMGIYMTVHIAALIIKRMLVFARKNFFSLLIVITVVLSISISVALAVDTAISDRSNIYLYQSILTNCKEDSQVENKKKIVIRIDDIQAFWINNLQLKMLNELKKRDIPAMLSVVPRELRKDKKVYHYLKNNECFFEIALHGWDQGEDSNYTLPEFGKLNEEDARIRIIKGKRILSRITSDLTTFVPPNNQFSKGTKDALLKEDFKIISAEGTGTFDYSASTYNFVDGTLEEIDIVIADCEDALYDNDLCVVMIHPQDYITHGEIDDKKYSLYIETLDRLEKLDAMFTTPKKIINQEK